MMRTSPEAMDNFVERNQVESVEEIIAAASWKKSNRLRLALERVTARVSSWVNAKRN
jgi:hypothetical protein